MSFKEQIEIISKEMETHREKIQSLQTELIEMQKDFAEVLQKADNIVKCTSNLAQKLEIPCKETISFGESLKILQDYIKEKLQTNHVKWEDMEPEITKSNSCLQDYLDHYQTTVLNLADQTSMELDPNDSSTIASPKSSLESSSSHFQQMLVAHDPLADRDLFINLDAKDLSVVQEIQTMKEQLEKFKETNLNIATEVERISTIVQEVCKDDCTIETETVHD